MPSYPDHAAALIAATNLAEHMGPAWEPHVTETGSRRDPFRANARLELPFAGPLILWDTPNAYICRAVLRLFGGIVTLAGHGGTPEAALARVMAAIDARARRYSELHLAITQSLRES
jgi:hypothetical protein